MDSRSREGPGALLSALRLAPNTKKFSHHVPKEIIKIKSSLRRMKPSQSFFLLSHSFSEVLSTWKYFFNLKKHYQLSTLIAVCLVSFKNSYVKGPLPTLQGFSHRSPFACVCHVLLVFQNNTNVKATKREGVSQEPHKQTPLLANSLTNSHQHKHPS